jgi:hypothetical protein
MATKTKPICFRTDPETRARIEDAARRRGKSLTTFILDATLDAAKKAEAAPALADRQFRGVPSYFKACCWEASRGGQRGYKTPAYELCRHLAASQPYGLEDDEWEAELQELAGLLAPPWPGNPDMIAFHLRDDGAVWAWFERHFPKCMELVPRRRRGQFVAGVYEAYDDEIIELPA